MRSTRFQNKERFFHFASRIRRPEWQKLTPSQRWMLLKLALKQLHKNEGAQWIAGVLMGTHFHLLFALAEPKENILMLDLEKLICEPMNWSLPLFEQPILCERISNLSQYKKTYKYIYRNPVEAHLCLQVQDYPWSSLQEILKPPTEPVFIDANFLIQNPFKTLQWLNEKELCAGLQSSFLI